MLDSFSTRCIQNSALTAFLHSSLSTTHRRRIIVGWIYSAHLASGDLRAEEETKRLPSHSQCPVRRWPRPGATLWGCGGWLLLWQYAASGHLTAVFPYRLPECHTSAHTEREREMVGEHNIVNVSSKWRQKQPEIHIPLSELVWYHFILWVNNFLLISY